jgi:enoyl-CoA hydratase
MMAKIQYSTENGTALIAMDDGKANAMDFDFFTEMGQALDRVENDGAGTLIITGRPGYFSGGLDVRLLTSLPPQEVNRLADTFARTMLRFFSFPIPTIAVLSGHAVAGGAMLSFVCDLRFAVEGTYRIQMNEMVIGIPLPTWMLMIGSAVIPEQWLAETFLHGRAYLPDEAVGRGLVHGMIRNDEDPIAGARSRTEHLKSVNLQAYQTSKARLRDADVRQVLELLKGELPFKGL